MEKYMARFSYDVIEFEEFYLDHRTLTSEAYFQAENADDLNKQVLEYFEGLNSGSGRIDRNSAKLIDILQISPVDTTGIMQKLQESASKQLEADRIKRQMEREEAEAKRRAQELEKLNAQKADIVAKLSETERKIRAASQSKQN